MSHHEDGYVAGHEDGLAGNSNKASGNYVINLLLPTSEAEVEWNAGYEEGYANGEAERENS